MRVFIFPALCAMALLTSASLSYAAASTQEVSTAQATIENSTKPIYDSWQDDTTQLPY